MKILAFGYKSRAGKSTAQGFLVSHLRTTSSGIHAQRGSLALNIKRQAATTFGLYGLMQPEVYEEEKNAHLRDIKLPIINKTPVEIWAEFGKFLVGFDENYTVSDLIASNFDCDLLVVSDLRRVSEANYIKTMGGLVVRIDRPESVVKTSIDAELDGFDKWDAVIDNSKDLKHLHQEVVRIAKELLC